MSLYKHCVCKFLLTCLGRIVSCFFKKFKGICRNILSNNFQLISSFKLRKGEKYQTALSFIFKPLFLAFELFSILTSISFDNV